MGTKERGLIIISGGHLTNHTYSNDTFANDVFDWRVNCHYGFKRREEEYKNDLRMVRKQNPMRNVVISEMLYDMMCLVNSADYYVSGDTGSDTYDEDIKFFTDKWLKRSRKDIAQSIVDNAVDDLKTELYKTFGINQGEK